MALVDQIGRRKQEQETANAEKERHQDKSR